MRNSRIIPAYDSLEAPYIKVDTVVRVPGATNGKPNIKRDTRYVIAPTAKKIATYIVNQIFGSELVTQTEGLSVNWLMPTLKESLELGIYEQESFVYIHKYDDKIYLECFNKHEIHNLEQKFDKVIGATICQEFDGNNGSTYILERDIQIEDGNSFIKLRAYVEEKGKKQPVPISVFNMRTGNDYIDKYILPYEVLINIDIGEDFFKDSKKLLNEEMKIFNVIADEVEKTKTRVVTTQHYQSGDIVTNWQPGNTHYQVESINVGQLQDYFTLLPGDKEHQMFEFLQGNVRIQEYITTFRFYDQQIIQMAGLSPASFGYEKDSYMNTDNVNLSKNNSEMTIEAIKNQIENQINKLLQNIVKAQQTQNITINEIPDQLNWDYGNNEALDDMKRLAVLKKVLGVASVPYSTRAKVIAPIINKLIDDNYDEKEIDNLINEYKEEQKNISVDYGEI